MSVSISLTAECLLLSEAYMYDGARVYVRGESLVRSSLQCVSREVIRGCTLRCAEHIMLPYEVNFPHSPVIDWLREITIIL